MLETRESKPKYWTPILHPYLHNGSDTNQINQLAENILMAL